MRLAIRELAIGKRVVSISFTGPPARSESYQMVEIDKLTTLLVEINREISGGAGVRLAASRNGLGGPSRGGFGSGGGWGCR